MTNINGKLKDQNVELYSLCYDHPFIEEFEKDIESYKNVLIEFKNLVDMFLTKVGFDIRIEFMGYTPATKFIEDNREELGEQNYDYVIKRYFSICNH